MTVDLASLIDPAATPDADRERLRVHRGAGLGPARAAACSSATSPATRAGAGRAPSGMELDLVARRSRATAWRSTTTGTCSSASRSSSCLVRFRDGRRELVAYHYRGQVPEQPERRRHARQRRQHLLHRSRLRPLERLDRPGAHARTASATARVFRVPPGGGELELVVARGRVRPAERPLLLARREAPLRQRLRQPHGQGLRRRRGRLARASAR